MRLPLLRPYRMFREFDHLSDSECERHVRDAYINAPGLTARLPLLWTTFCTGAWFIGWPVSVAFLPVSSFVPIPSSTDWQIVAYLAGGAAWVAAWYLLSRDVGVFLAMRRELSRCRCRKCGQSLQGLPIQFAGSDPDPAKRFVRCTECGRRWVLLDLGLTPRDLVPFEQRVMDARVAQRR